jgi:pSer/pThr/pTyr-binding forkhead associated (FHA) protein
VSEFTFIEQKPSQGAEHPVESGTTIGREGCDITLSDPDVSRRHAAIQIVAGELSIEDLGSTNGTVVNGETITERRSLREGDEIQIGSTVWRLRAPAGATRLTNVPSGATKMSQATTLRPAAPEPPAAAPEPPAAAPEPPTEEAPPATPSVAAESVPPVAPPAPAATPTPAPAPPAPSAATPAPAGAPARRGDVPQPDFAPSAIRRVVPGPGTPAAFTPETQAPRKGSAATRGGATLMATVLVALTTVGVVLYYITEPFK